MGPREFGVRNFFLMRKMGKGTYVNWWLVWVGKPCEIIVGLPDISVVAGEPNGMLLPIGLPNGNSCGMIDSRGKSNDNL